VRRSLDKGALGRARLVARRNRIGLIRRRVAGFSALLFVVVWVVLFGQLLIGRDPALAGKAVTRREAAGRHRRAHRERARVVDLGTVRRRSVAKSPPSDSAAVPATAAPAQPERTSPRPTPAPPQPAPTPVTTSQS
jgi:hypothetical protein